MLFAKQDKVWVTGPAGEKWEVYTVLADSDVFGTSPELLAADPQGGCSCESCDSAEPADQQKGCRGHFLLLSADSGFRQVAHRHGGAQRPLSSREE